MIHINHIAIATQNVYEAAFRLRNETHLGFYDGGWNEGGGGNMIVPIGGSYLQMTSLAEATLLDDPKNAGAKRMLDSTAVGDRFQSLNLRVDTPEELAAIGAPFGMTTTHGGRGRVDASGNGHNLLSLTGGKGMPPGTPNFYCFLEMWAHPSGQPVDQAYGLIRPLGVSWVEYGGTEEAFMKVAGAAGKDVPIKFNGKANGVYAVGVKTANGEIVIRRKATNEA